MIRHVDDCYFYSRKDNVIIANLTDGQQVPLVRLKQNFIDVTVLEGQGFDYMKRYMEMFPHLWEIIKQENSQLTLF